MLSTATIDEHYANLIYIQLRLMINVALIDDHAVVRSGFAQLLGLAPEIQIVGQYASAANAWSSLLKMNIDVAVMDIAMPDESGLNRYDHPCGVYGAAVRSDSGLARTIAAVAGERHTVATHRG